MTVFVYKGLIKIPKIGTLPSEFFPMAGDWVKLGIPNLSRMSLIKIQLTLQNAKVTASTVSELLRENSFMYILIIIYYFNCYIHNKFMYIYFFRSF